MENNKTIRAVIVDDEPLARDVIQTLTRKNKNIKVIAECTNGKSALETIIQDRPDLVFLDVEMPDMNGFEVIKALSPDEMPLIIFTTAFDQYAIPAFEANALDYLLKPFDKERFNSSLEKAINRLQLLDRSTLSNKINMLLEDYDRLKKQDLPGFIHKLTIRQKNKIRFIKIKDVQWIEASGDYICVHSNGEKYLMNDSMNKMAEKLDPSLFMRIHRSTIVSIEEILEIEPYFNGEYFIHLKDQTKLKSSRSYKEVISRLIK